MSYAPVDPGHLLASTFSSSDEPVRRISVPGRVNLIGEHVDYHNLPVLPMALQRRVSVAYRARRDRLIRVVSEGYGNGEFCLDKELRADPPGVWLNYIKAAAQTARGRWPLEHGIDAAVTSDLPPAAGLSSSSALLTAVLLALLDVNGIQADFAELIAVLPDGEQFVGTRGGGMDHAAVHGARHGHALLVRFAPVVLAQVPIPTDWAFLVAHSMSVAEKSGAVRAEYNARRTAGLRSRSKLGLSSYRDAVAQHSFEELMRRARRGVLAPDEMRAFTHVAGEAFRVEEALTALRSSQLERFGQLLCASHASLRDQLGVSTPALDRLVNIAMESGASGARLTGAGFGGCAIVVCPSRRLQEIREKLAGRYYAGRPGFEPGKHLIVAEASGGALDQTSGVRSQESEGSEV
jgi:galactokinase